MMTKKEAQAFIGRYQAVNELEIDELRRTSEEVKLAQLASLMHFARVAGWDSRLAEEVLEVRQRWLRLKRLLTP